MSNFETGQKVTWIKEMAIVPHPEGKTDRKGNVLPVFRDKEMTGTVIGPCSKGYLIRPYRGRKFRHGKGRYSDSSFATSKIKAITENEIRGIS